MENSSIGDSRTATTTTWICGYYSWLARPWIAESAAAHGKNKLQFWRAGRLTDQRRLDDMLAVNEVVGRG